MSAERGDAKLRFEMSDVEEGFVLATGFVRTRFTCIMAYMSFWSKIIEFKLA